MKPADTLTLPQTHSHIILPEYIDRMGHMNVMYYTHIFDLATLGFFECFGFGLPYFKMHPSGSMAVERHTRYHKEIRLDEEITVYTRALGRGRSGLHFMHFMLRTNDNAFISTTEMITLHIDMNVRKSASFPAEIATRYDALLIEHEGLDWAAPICGAMGIKTK